MSTKVERELIRQLGKKTTDRIPYHLGLKEITENDPEYWGLAGIVTDEMAAVALKMDVRKPITCAELAKKCKMTEAELQPILDKLAYTGVIEYNWENEDRHKQYVLLPYVPGSGEFFNMNPDIIDNHPEVADFFEHMTRLPLEKVTPMVPPGGAGIGMHVIPVEKAIPSKQEALSIEMISHWLDKYDGRYAAAVCSCRRAQSKRGEGSGEIPQNCCIAVGDMAQYVVETNKGYYITREEVMETLERCERNGYVHQITNIDGPGKIFAICNCAPGVCYALRTSQLFNTPNMSASAYRAQVEAKKCVACGKCVEVCPVGAAKLGQKLCTKNGPIQYPKSELPDEVKWGKEKWNWNYKEDAKKHVYETGTAPCKTACPAHLAIQGYIKMASEGRYLDALKLIKQDNPFPAVCGAICNRRCEDACTRGKVDEPLAIDEIKKFIAAQELNAETRYVPLCENMEGKFFTQKIAVIGAGPAGMSAAFYLRKIGYPVTIFEKESRPGGMLMNGIPSFRLEKDVIEAEIEVLRQMGVEFKCNVEIGVDETFDSLRAQGYKAFYLAIGAQGGRKTGVPGEDAQGVETGVEFLKRVNLDETIKVEGKTVVVGGGNVAIDVARTALRAGSSEIVMACLEQREEMPASNEEVEEALEEGIQVNCGWGPKEILTENGKVTGIVFKKCTSVKDETGRFNPQYDENDTLTIKCDNVLLSIGQAIIWKDMLKGTKVEINRNGTVKADPATLQTAEPDIFVGGDVYTGPRFAIDAIAAAKPATDSINRFVHPGQSMTIARDLHQFIELDKDNVVLESFDTAKRQIPGKKAGVAKETFRDLRSPFTEEQVKAEASRCLGCGASIVDENRCIGCGLCTTKCEFDAIHLIRSHPECSTMYKSEDKLKAILPYAAKREIKIRKANKKNK